MTQGREVCDCRGQQTGPSTPYEGTIEYFVNTVFNYPTLAEAYKIAALDGMDKL